MRKVLIAFVSVGLLISCATNDKINSDLIGKWKLIEVLADPGDGSGTFHSVSSGKIIEFHSDGTVTSNGSICDMSIESDLPSTGTYSLADSTLNSANCAHSVLKIKFGIIGSTLIINYPCDEACSAKYIKE
jgi:hypothetical protein